MKEKISELVEKIMDKYEMRVLYMYDPLGNVKVKVYDKDYRLVLSNYGSDTSIYKILKAIYE